MHKTQQEKKKNRVLLVILKFTYTRTPIGLTASTTVLKKKWRNFGQSKNSIKYSTVPDTTGGPSVCCPLRSTHDPQHCRMR